MARLPNLARLRAERNLSQAELAELCGLDISTIGDLETGRTTRPSAKTIGALARGLGMSVLELDALLAGEPEEASA